jgi:hypothetical protein
MRLLSRLALALVLAGGAVVALPMTAPAHATTLALLTPDQMTDASDLVVRGTVVDTWSEYDTNSHVVTYATVQVTEGYKGTVAAGDFVTVETPGGVVGDVVGVVEGAARYDKGEDVFLFLAEKRFGTSYGTVGMWLGKFTVKPNPTDGRDMLVRFTVPWGQRFDARFVPSPPAAQRVAVSDFGASVRARVALGWDGAPIPGISNAKLRQINKLQPGVR